jgi:hypothetical protein
MDLSEPISKKNLQKAIAILHEAIEIQKHFERMAYHAAYEMGYTPDRVTVQLINTDDSCLPDNDVIIQMFQNFRCEEDHIGSFDTTLDKLESIDTLVDAWKAKNGN